MLVTNYVLHYIPEEQRFYLPLFL